MERTKISDFRSMTIEELRAAIDERRKQVFSLREKKVVEELTNPFELRHFQKEIARIRTIIRERELADAPREKSRTRAQRKKASRRSEVKTR